GRHGAGVGAGGKEALTRDRAAETKGGIRGCRPARAALRGTHGRVGDLQPRFDGGGVAGTHQDVRPGLSARHYLQCPCPSPGEILMQDDVVALFAYDRWANTKVLDACRKLTAEQYVAEPVPGWSSVRSTIYHIALATDGDLRT